jgi:CheY-like chemotaxis protein
MNDDGSIMPTRVLLVEDHEPFRRFVRAKLQEHKDLLLADEAGNGFDAVSKCLALQPGLVLMDIGLPGLNGIEAARRIHALVPTCKIVFLTQESSPEIVHEALNLGAAGYVIKAYAANDLMSAITAAREGRQFVSQAVASGDGLGAGAHTLANDFYGDRMHEQPGTNHHHVAHFHRDTSSLLAEYVGFVEDTLNAGTAVIAITTGPHREEILETLQARGVDVASAMDAGRLVALDVDETLASFMADDLPDPTRFFSAAGEIVKSVKARNQGSRVVAFGEIAPTLWARGNGRAAIQLEYLWDQIVRMYELETLCGYMLTGSQRTRDRRTFDGVCAAHSSIRSF